jgi:transcriptional regulator with XRE-family HTH domain
MNIFNKRVKELRNEMNLSLRQLSSLSGLSPSAIHAYEIGTREPTKSSLEALSDVFNCDIDYLLGKSDIKNLEANKLGYTSLYEAFKKNTTPEEPKLTEGEEMLLELFRKLPKEAQESYTERLREALRTLGLI